MLLFFLQTASGLFTVVTGSGCGFPVMAVLFGSESVVDDSR